MALQSRINEIYPNRKPFMEQADGKRKASGKDLRVQVLLGAQEAAKRQCTDGDLPQEQQPPHSAMQDDHANHRASIDFSGFYHQLHRERQVFSRSFGGILQESPQQNIPAAEAPQQLVDHSREQQQQHDGLEAVSSWGIGQDLHQQQQHLALSTLDRLMSDHDLGSRHKPPDRELKQMKSLQRVFGADTSRDGFPRGPHETAGAACNRSNSSASAAGGAAAAAVAAAAAAATAREQHSWHLSQLPHIPWDCSVKSSARFSSPQPFNVLQQAQEEGLDSMCRAHAAAGGAPPAAAAGQASYQERLQHALVQWQYPSAPLPHALLAAQSSTAAAAAAAAATGGPATAAAAAERSRSDPAALLLQERVQQWREALRAAYLALRHGFCPAVYICGQAFKQPFTAVLCAPGVMGPTDSSSSTKFTAVLSRSNRLLRGHLALYGCEAAVTGQLEQQQAAAAAAAAAQQQQGKQHPQQQHQQAAAAFDGQPGSQMLLVGVQHMHGLYAALLALPWCEPGQPDVPLLSAPVPFLHAQLCPLRLVALPDAVLDQQQQQQQRGPPPPAAAPPAAEAAPALPPPLHYVELRAPGALVMPWTLHRLLGVLRDTQGLEGFQAFLGTEPCSSSLNVLPEHWAAAAAAAAAGVGGGGGSSGAGDAQGPGRAQQQQQQQQWRLQGRGLSSTEVACWGGSGTALLLHGRALRQLKLEEGCIAAKLV